MNILYVTLNSSLRSTTCVIDAAVGKLQPLGVNPIFVFPESGPWAETLKSKGIPCYFKEFLTPEKTKPLQFISNLLFWLKLFKRHKIQILHMNEHDYYPMLKHAAYLAKIPIVVGVRFVLEGGYAKWAFAAPYAPKKLLFTSHDQLARSRDELPADIPDSAIDVFGNGRDLDQLIAFPDVRNKTRESWSAQEQDIVLGTASAIRPRKRIEDFILLVDHLIKKGHKVKGVIGGGGKYADKEYFEALEQQIINLGLSEHVKMLGNMDEMAPFYQGIDIFVSTSELETFGMSVCEAMAFAKPVFGYEGGSVQEVLADPRFIVENKNLELLKALAEALLNEPESFNEIGIKHKKRVFDNFNADALADKLRVVYEQIDANFTLVEK